MKVSPTAGRPVSRACGAAAWQLRQHLAVRHARVEQHAALGIGQDDVAAETLPETLRLLIKRRVPRHIIHQRRDGQHVQGTHAGFQLLVDRIDELADQDARCPFAFFAGLAYLLPGQIGRKQHQRPDAEPDQAAQEMLQRSAHRCR
ncbi:MAG: hypothetical protein RLY71_3307 [Pseudomonadota bacterium]|jgi:hypothetical protein